MRLNKTLQFAVDFANYCEIEQLEPYKVAELRALVDRKVNLWVRQNNEQIYTDVIYSRRMEKLKDQIDEKAREMGITNLKWPGLYPIFSTPGGGKDRMLPEPPR